MKKYKKITECIGNTPLVDIPLINKSLHARILVKLESFNPCSSIKDRIALAMIEGAEKAERIKPGDKLIEPSSGNTGIGLAFVAAAKGYKLCVTMPANMSVERQTIMKALGAEIVLTNPDKGMKGAIEAAQNLARERGAYLLKQFENPDNPLIHRWYNYRCCKGS
jgi:cysteine synthase A